jgi:hypothetical protein
MMLKSFLWLLSGGYKNITAVKRAFKDFFLGRMGRTEHTLYSNQPVNI